MSGLLKPIDERKTELLLKMATKYIWWKTSDEAIEYPIRVVLQVMNLGTYEDIQALKRLFNDDELRSAVIESEIGQLSKRALNYWVLVLKLPEETKNKVRVLKSS